MITAFQKREIERGGGSKPITNDRPAEQGMRLGGEGQVGREFGASRRTQKDTEKQNVQGNAVEFSVCWCTRCQTAVWVLVGAPGVSLRTHLQGDSKTQPGIERVTGHFSHFIVLRVSSSGTHKQPSGGC